MVLHLIVPESFKLRISNFSPIEEIEIDICKSNYQVLIGPNMGGKSSILNVLLLLKQIIDNKNLDNFINRSFRQRLITNQSFNEEAVISFSFALSNICINDRFLEPYGFSRQHYSSPKIEIVFSVFISAKEIREQLLYFSPYTNKMIVRVENFNLDTYKYYSDIEQNDIDYLFAGTDPAEPLIKSVTHSGSGGITSLMFRSYDATIDDLIREIKLFFSSIHVLKPSRRANKSGSIVLGAELSPSGDNLCEILHSLYSNNPDVFHRIEEELKRLFPKIKRLLTPIIGANEISLMVIFHHEEQQGFEVWIDELSTGLIEVLQLLTFYFSNPNDSILLIEEIERALHPGLQKAIMNIFIENISDRTIILATHSSHVLRSDSKGNRSWFLVNNGKLSNFTFTSSDEWKKLNYALGIDPRQLFFSKGIIFCEGSSELALHKIIDLDTNIEKNTIDLVEIKGSSTLRHVSFSEFLKFLNNSGIKFLICFDKDTEPDMLTFINTNKFIDKELIVIWHREFEEALGVDNYVDICCTYTVSNPEVTEEEIKMRLFENLKEGNLLSKSAQKTFHELNIGDIPKPELAEKTIDKMISEMKKDVRKELSSQLQDFLSKLTVFY